MVDRKGATGTWIGRNVYIESKIVTRANALIYPRIRLGIGSKVEPDTIVKKLLTDNKIHRAPGGKRDLI